MSKDYEDPFVRFSISVTRETRNTFMGLLKHGDSTHLFRCFVEECLILHQQGRFHKVLGPWLRNPNIPNDVQVLGVQADE